MSADAGLLVIPPYGSIGGYLVYCVFAIFRHFVILFVFLYGYGFLSGGKGQGREILHAYWPSIRTGLLPFGEHWLAGSHGGGGTTSGVNGSGGTTASVHGMGIGNWGRRRCLRPYGGICVLQAC